MQTNKWETYSIKRQLFTIFMLFAGISLFIMGASCITFIVVSGDLIKTELHNNFLKSATNDMIKIVTAGSKLFDKKLNGLTSNLPLLMKNNAEDSFRTDFPFGIIPSHYNWPGQFIDQSYIGSYNANVSFVHSSINVYNKSFYDISSFSPNMKSLIDVTAQMDYLFVPSFNQSKDFLQCYMYTQSQFQRTYPATINYKNVYNYINYDGINDYWYVSSLSNPSTVSYTSPYYDQVAGQLMITVSNTLNDPYNGNLIGALGADLILKTFQNEIKKLTYLNKGRTILFEKDSGYVIADSEYNVTSLITYNSLKNLSISTNLWNELINNEHHLIYDKNNYFVSAFLDTSNNKYVLISLIDKSHILNIFSKITDSVKKTVTLNSIIVPSVCFGIYIFAILLIYYLASSIVSSLQQLADTSSAIAKRIGEESLTEGVNVNFAQSGVAEINESVSQFKRTLQQLATSNVDNNQNVYYNNMPWNYDMTYSQHSTVPSAPVTVSSVPVMGTEYERKYY